MHHHPDVRRTTGKVWKCSNYSQEFLQSLIPNKEEEPMQDKEFDIRKWQEETFILHKRSHRGGSQRDPDKKDKIRISVMCSNKKPDVFHIMIGMNIIKRMRWVHGDRIMVRINNSIPRRFSLTRISDPEALYTYALIIGKKNLLTSSVRTPITEGLENIKGILTTNIIYEEPHTLVCEIPLVGDK